MQGWTPEAIHTIVNEIVADRAFHRSVLGSILGRALLAVIDAVNWLIRTFRRVPGGRTTVIVVLATVVLLVLGRIFYAEEWGDRDRTRRRKGIARSGRVDPWSEAEQLASAGDHTAAAHALYRAVLRRLAGTERIRLHASKTTGDYWRELRRRGSPSAGPFRQFGRHFDRVIFGLGACSPQEFESMRDEAIAVLEPRVAT